MRLSGTTNGAAPASGWRRSGANTGGRRGVSSKHPAFTAVVILTRPGHRRQRRHLQRRQQRAAETAAPPTPTRSCASSRSIRDSSICRCRRRTSTRFASRPRPSRASPLSSAKDTSSGSAGPENLEGLFVTAGYFELLGTRAALGRTFTEEDERPGGADRVILSDRIWRTRLGADPAIIGRTRQPVATAIRGDRRHRARAGACRWTSTLASHGETVDFWIPPQPRICRGARGFSTPSAAWHRRVNRAGKRGARSPGEAPGAALAGLAHWLACQRRASG